jgi:hypothetical protein
MRAKGGQVPDGSRMARTPKQLGFRTRSARLALLVFHHHWDSAHWALAQGENADSVVKVETQ